MDGSGRQGASRTGVRIVTEPTTFIVPPNVLAMRLQTSVEAARKEGVRVLYFINSMVTPRVTPETWLTYAPVLADAVRGAYLLVGGGHPIWEEAIESLVNPRQSEMK